MKKLNVVGLLTFLLITNILFISTTVLYKNKIDKQVIKVYLFEGESKDIRISGGTIILSPNKQTISGGNIAYIGGKRTNINAYSKNIYLGKKLSKDIILSNSASFSGDNKGKLFSDEFLLNKSLGEISSTKLLSEDNINMIKDNLYFSLNYSTVDGQSGSFTIKLKVKEFNMNETK